ncbi:MAG: phospho-N-acetylmuramoyl-pentapeptide-transferase [Firmicutes bacterium]|nr:phospho-N-acetylmuramoyl-pentapeptide-transferase [Bacillota bacterium]
MKEILFYFLGGFGVAIIITPFIISWLRRLKAGQEILHYVDWHATKSGTPTMGGFIFMVPMLLLAPLLISGATPLSLILLLGAFGYGILGFLDDFLKIKNKKNLGLRAYQKFIGQGGIAILVSVFYFLANPDGQIFVPFANVTFNLYWGIIPLAILVMVATTNSVNITDGVDGLAGSVSLVYLVGLSVMMTMVAGFVNMPEVETFLLIAAVTMGALLCYLIFNTNKARVFMGDTGSLYLGGLIALLSLFSMNVLFLPILGIMFVLNTASDIAQVVYFKLTKGKRIFLMAPFHHHLEKKGWAEARIVWLYCAITVIACVVCVITLL